MQASISCVRCEVGDPDYPPELATLQRAPRELFIAGTLPAPPRVAIVGSRRMTDYGRRVTTTLVLRLAGAGIPIVSGLAFGVDATAHRAAIQAGGCSIAVLPAGLSARTVSPRSHLALAEQILTRGALLSEYGPAVTARKEHYPARNRLIVGLTTAVVVVEAADPSGSTLTGRLAGEEGIDVWAVPGPIDSPVSQGTNRLIDEGARPLRQVESLLETLGFTASGPPILDREPLLAHFSKTPRHLDAVAVDSGLASSELERAVTRLELVGLLQRVGGKYFVRP